MLNPNNKQVSNSHNSHYFSEGRESTFNKILSIPNVSQECRIVIVKGEDRYSLYLKELSDGATIEGISNLLESEVGSIVEDCDKIGLSYKII